MGKRLSVMRYVIFWHYKTTRGDNDNHTPVQFRKLIFSSFFTSSAGNCAADFDDLTAECTDNKKSSTPVLAGKTQPQTNIIKENAIHALNCQHKCK